MTLRVVLSKHWTFTLSCASNHLVSFEHLQQRSARPSATLFQVYSDVLSAIILQSSSITALLGLNGASGIWTVWCIILLAIDVNGLLAVGYGSLNSTLHLHQCALTTAVLRKLLLHFRRLLFPLTQMLVQQLQVSREI